jgi:hypothetical protein
MGSVVTSPSHLHKAYQSFLDRRCLSRMALYGRNPHERVIGGLFPGGNESATVAWQNFSMKAHPLLILYSKRTARMCAGARDLHLLQLSALQRCRENPV